jgi:hypothetical protein
MGPPILKVELTREEHDTLLMMAGIATGAALRDNMPHMAVSFLRLINAVNRNNPDWTPYEDKFGTDDKKNPHA